MFTWMARAVMTVVGALAVPVVHNVVAKPVFRSHAIMMIFHELDRPQEHEEGSLLQSLGEVWILSAGMLAEITRSLDSGLRRSHS